MANAKEIRSKIRSVQNTQKITRAMEMVSASKMRRAQERMQSSRPYSQRIAEVINHLAKAHPEYRHLYLEERDVKRVGIILVSTDRSLCGGLNVNLFRKVVQESAVWSENGAEVDFCLIGSKADAFFRRIGGNIIAQAAHLGDAPSPAELIGAVKVMLDAYAECRLDRIYLAYNRYVNTMVQAPTVTQLLPLVPEDDGEVHHWDYLYEPDAKSLLNGLLARHIESQVYQGVVENIASEQAARMVAMKAASDNAGDMIEQFQLAYNKARQAAITQELSEIVAGAAAV